MVIVEAIHHEKVNEFLSPFALAVLPVFLSGLWVKVKVVYRRVFSRHNLSIELEMYDSLWKVQGNDQWIVLPTL